MEMKIAKESIRTITVVLCAVGISSLLWFFIAIFFIDSRWWWFLLELASIAIALLIVDRRDLFGNMHLLNTLRCVVGHLCPASLLFVVCALFITPWWWFGLLIPLSLGILWLFLYEEQDDTSEATVRRKPIMIGVAAAFVLAFSLFCVPSYVANNHRNPRERFANFAGSFFAYAVDSYVLYGPLTTNDTEHVVAQAWFESDANYVNDYVNVIHTNREANAAKMNHPFGNVARIAANEVRSGTTIVGYDDGERFMPTDEFKGDVARIVLYMYVTYRDDGLPMENIDIGLMKDWHHQDPVSTEERTRNEAIKSSMGYGNRFVETPWLAGFVA
jgi:hypothetical protein